MNISTEVTFGAWLKRRRKAGGWTQEQLAVKVSCSTITLRKIESEERRPSAQTVERLAEIFNIPSNEQLAFLRFARGDWKYAPAVESEDAPWHVSTKSPRSNLPASLTSLIGRDSDIAIVREYLSNVDIRLVNLIGPPGIGKTRLSLEVAREVFDDFPDGAFFVALAPLEEQSLIAPTMVQALGFVETKNQPALERIQAGIGDKQMLIVLDNVEHLIEGTAALVSELLSACPRLKILTTSREALRVPGEWLYPVTTLNVPTETQLQSINIEEGSKYAALTLFAERARAVRPDFTLNTDNIRAITAICIQLDGLPLAIELISARVRLMSAQTLLAKLNDQFVLSADGMRAVPARQKTLHNAISWSYNLLSPEEQKMFARLSVFSGGFTLEAAEAIFSQTTADKSVSDLIASLLDKSLLQRTIDAGARGETRFSMLVTIQKFALDRLQSIGEESEVRYGHFDYFLNLAEAGEPHMYGHGQLEWLGHLQAELDNFRGAFEWNLAQQINVEKSLRLASALGSFWRIHSDFHEAQHWLEIVLSLDEAEHYPNVYAKALLIMGIFQMMYVSPEVGEPLLSQSVMLARRLDDNQILGEALDYLGLALAFQKKFDQAHTLLEESQMLFHAANDKKGIALTKWHLGWIFEDEGNQTTGFELIKQALTLLEELGDIHRQSILLRSIGWHLLEAGDFKQGSATLRRALSAAYKVGSKLEVGNTFMDLAFVAEQQSNFAKSVQFLWTAQKLYLACGARDISDFDQRLDRLRAHLDQHTFEVSLAQAQGWTMEQAIAYALEDQDC
jgi:predicted ATPase/transcriptional regulator with XRE-family HTH domain